VKREEIGKGGKREIGLRLVFWNVARLTRKDEEF